MRTILLFSRTIHLFGTFANLVWVIVNMSAVQSKKLIDPLAVGKAIGVPEWTVRELFRKGFIPGVQVTKKALRFDLDDVIAALKARSERRIN
jgi:hypothetical protein